MTTKVANGLDLQNQKIVGVGDPNLPLDAVNLQTLQNFIRGIASVKEAVRAGSTANIVLTAPGATVDGVAMVVGDRFLAKDQTVSAEKGLYVWNGAAVAATRALDADTNGELKPGTMVTVTEGTTNADKVFTIISDVTIIIGTTAQTWSQFGGGTTYTASNGVLLTGANFTAVAAPSGGLTVGGTGISIDTTVVARKFAVTIGTGALTSINVAHNLGTLDVEPQLREVATGLYWLPDVTVVDANNITFNFATAPTTGQFRAIVLG
jgi:hypothetical protein